MIENLRKILPFAVLFVVVFYSCLTKEPNPKFRAPRLDTTAKANPITTIPGNNIFSTNLGGLSVIVHQDSLVTYTYHGGRCDTSAGRYTLTMQASVPGWAFVNVIFNQKPTENRSYEIVPYPKSSLDDTTAWAMVTRIERNIGITWRATKGKVNVVVDEAGLVSATFLNLPLENTSNITDTSVVSMSASLFCR